MVPPHCDLGVPEGLCLVAKLSHNKNPVLASSLDHLDPHRSRHRGHAEENTGIGFCHSPRPCRPQDAADGAAGISRYHSESGEDLWKCTALGLNSLGIFSLFSLWDVFKVTGRSRPAVPSDFAVGVRVLKMWKEAGKRHPSLSYCSFLALAAVSACSSSLKVSLC